MNGNKFLNQLRALEIIKNKMVDMLIFLHSEDLKTYNNMVEDERKLTNDEYIILRWALL